MFDRFSRTDPARQRATGGTGLGLAIVKHLVEAQGGRVRAASDADSVTLSVEPPGPRRAPTNDCVVVGIATSKNRQFLAGTKLSRER